MMTMTSLRILTTGKRMRSIEEHYYILLHLHCERLIILHHFLIVSNAGPI
jgi:hypothetical protein